LTANTKKSYTEITIKGAFKMEKITFKTLALIMREYEVEFIKDYTIRSNKLDMTGTPYKRGGYAIKDMEELKEHLHEVYRPRDIDIGYFDLECMEDWKEAYERNGYEIEVKTLSEE
jgi:hypothetical protein